MPNDSETHNSHNRGNTLRKVSDYVLAHRRRVIAAWLIVGLVGFAFAGSVSKRLSTDFSLPGQPGYKVAKDIEKQYGNGGESESSLIVVTPASSTPVLTSQPQIDAAIAAARTQHPDVRIVDYSSTGDKSLITSDGKTEYAMLFTPLPTSFGQEPVSKQVATSIQNALPNSTVTATGLQELSVTNDSKGTGVFAETMIAGLGALAVLAYVFASFLALIPLLIAFVAICTTLLIVLALTTFAEVSFIVLFLVSLVGLGVAIDYSLLVVTRWREELSKGSDNAEAIRTAMATAGHAVLLSGLTVAIGLCALVVLPVPSLRSVGYGGMLIPLISVAVTLTFLPALLGGIGQKLNWPKLRNEEQPSRFWTGWARMIVHRRWPAAIAATALLALMIVPLHDLKIGETSSSALAKSGPAYNAYQTLLQGGVATGVLTPIEVLADRDVADQAAQQLRSVSGIKTVMVSNSTDSNKGNTTVLIAIPNKETTNSSATAPVKDARKVIAGMDGVVGLTGSGAIQLDYMNAVFGNAVWVFLIIGFLTFVLLARAFHSVVLAVKALILNIISLSAIFGCLTFFWQQGHGSGSIFNVPATGSITFWIPTMVFAFLFGLSMDYEVFIIARMREEYDRTGSTNEAVVVGLGRTGRLVTSAALILFMAFASLALSGFTDLKVLATGLGAGILLDATLIRAFLLPALVALFGEWNWWMPQSLATVLRTERPQRAGAAPEITPTT